MPIEEIRPLKEGGQTSIGKKANVATSKFFRRG
jgi:hypothetical protein